MKITIDTKDDSHEDLKKVIRMLESLVGEHPYSNQPSIFGDNLGSNPSADNAVSAFGAMFGDDVPSNSQPAASTVIENKDDELVYKEPAELEVY